MLPDPDLCRESGLRPREYEHDINLYEFLCEWLWCGLQYGGLECERDLELNPALKGDMECLYEERCFGLEWDLDRERYRECTVNDL